MELEDILIKKEEIPIVEIPTGRSDRTPYFSLPIHPTLLTEDIQVDDNLANELFPKVVDDWYKDLKKYRDTVDSPVEQEWLDKVFLKEIPHVSHKYSEQEVPSLGWRNHFGTKKNGFVRYFEMERNIAGSIYISEDRFERVHYIGPREVKFSPEKFIEYADRERVRYINKNPSTGVVANIYSHHNVEIYPGALMLRNLAIEYNNEVIRQNKEKFVS